MKAQRHFALWLTGLALLTLLVGLSSSVGAAPPQPSIVQTATDQALGRINSPTLRQAAQTGSRESYDVIVLMRAGTDLRGLLSQALVRKPIGQIQIATGRVVGNALAKLATLPGVIGIQSPKDLRTLDPVDPEGEQPTGRVPLKARLAKTGPINLFKTEFKHERAREAMAGPESYIGTDVMGARAAWAKGFTGNGVIVGEVDDSIPDFGHPDLEGQWATVTDPASPYTGWPMVYDPGSVGTYLATGEALSAQAVLNGTPGAGSYFVDTTTTATGTTASFTTVYYDANGVPQPATHTYTLPGTSQSGTYRMGIHPDLYLGLFDPTGNGEYAVLALVDENVAGVYDTVYVDFDYNYKFDTYERFTREQPSGWYLDTATSTWSRDFTGDDIADVSAGIMYWIADGTNFVPGTQVLFEDAANRKPTAYSLVAFGGGFNGYSHSTGVASAVLGAGRSKGRTGVGVSVLPWADVSGGVVWGTAPGAKIFGAPNTSPYDTWFLQAVGFDGEPDTGDEAPINTNSWGWLCLNDGWDSASRFVAYLNETLGLNTLWLSGTANGGFGFGSASCSAGSSPTALAVAAYNLKGTTNANEPIGTRDQVLWGDLTSWSSRGPNVNGRVGASVVAVGSGATGAMPLLLAAASTGVADGNSAWYEFGGTSQSTPFTAGVVALIDGAYYGKYNTWPSYKTAKQILMSSADSSNNDAFSQGAGRVNADRATDLAAGRYGVRVSPAVWEAGNYRGQKTPTFAQILQPGGLDTQTFTVHNPSAAPITVQVADRTLKQIGEWAYSFTTTGTQEDAAYRARRPDYLIPLYLKGGVNHIPAGTDLMVVSMQVPMSDLTKGDPTDVTNFPIDNLWYLKVYNWKDLNGNGVLWNDANGNGVVNDGELDNPPTSGGAGFTNSSLEFNEYGISYQYQTTREQRVERPLQRTDDGIYVGLLHYASAARKITRTAIPNTHVYIKVRFFQQQDWSLASVGLGSLTVPAGGMATFDATVSVPAGQAPGLYEGEITLADPGSASYPAHLTTVPVVVNVVPMVSATNLNFNLGGGAASGALFDNSRVIGGADWLGNGWRDQGDWRMFFVDVPGTIPAGTAWLVDTQWANRYTDVDTLIYGPSLDVFSLIDPATFGPYTLAQVGGSADVFFTPPQLAATSNGAYGWQTNTGGPREIVGAPVQSGLNAIYLHNVLRDGNDPIEAYSGQVGTMRVEPSPVEETAWQTSGSVDVSFTSSLALSGLAARTYGLSAPVELKDVSIHLGEEWRYTFDVADAGVMEVSTQSTDPNTSDIDLYLDRWTGSAWQNVGISGGATADEFIRLKLPADGKYRARVFGYAVNGEGKFDFRLNVLAGKDLTVTDLPSGAINPGQTVTFKLNFSKADLGTFEGIIFLGPTEAPTALELPVTIQRVAAHTVEITPDAKLMGYVDSLNRLGAYFGSGYLWTGQDTRPKTPRWLHGVVQFDLTSHIPAGATIVAAQVELTGRDVTYVSGQPFEVSLKLLDPNVDPGFAHLGYYQIHNASAVASAPMEAGSFGVGVANRFMFNSSAALAAFQSRLEGSGKASFRADGVLLAPYGRDIVGWDGRASAAPVLRIVYITE
jgi:hypothetical protein